MRIVHRDVSPSNILLDEDGRARLLDFGVARMRGGQPSITRRRSRASSASSRTARPSCSAGGEATPQSDLYSCAVVLHEMLLGRNVFRSESQAASMHRVMKHVPESVESARDDLPDELDPILQKALAKKPEQRFESAREFANALRKLQPEPESEVRAHLATLLEEDFGSEMAQLLGLESLADRDEAWRRLSQRPPNAPEGDDAAQDAVSHVRPFERSAAGAPPPAMGATQPAAPSIKRVTSPGMVAPQIPAPVPPAPPAPAPLAPPPSAGAKAVAAPSVVQPAPATPAPSQRGLMIALALVGCLAGAAIVLSLMNRPPP